MIDAFFIFGAKYAIYVMVVIAIAYFLSSDKLTRRKIIIMSAIVLPLSYLIAKIAGHLYFDPRPFIEGNFAPLIPHVADNGFPSDHALLASAMAAVLFPFKRTGSIILWIAALYVGISRVYVGVHHTIDILGSMIIVIATMTIVYSMIKHRLNPKVDLVTK